MHETYDLAVVGAGPAGISAAIQAATLGLSVVVLDEQPDVGGQIYRGQGGSALQDASILGQEYLRGAQLASAFRRSPAVHIIGAAVFNIDEEGWIGFEVRGEARLIRAEAIVLATGALERPFPIHGWTLPGVMTAGSAQILLKTAAAVPVQRTVLAGCGPLLYLVAWQLLNAGRRVDAILDTARNRNYLGAIRNPSGTLAGGRTLMKGLSLLAAIRRAGIRHIRNVTDLQARGDEAVRTVWFRTPKEEGELPTELLLLHQGVVPNIQLPGALRCEIQWNPRQLCWAPVLNDWGGTSKQRIWVAGDGGGILGANAAELTGRIAALAVAETAGRISVAERDRLSRGDRRRLARERRFRQVLDVLYQPPAQFRVPLDANTIVCRCEEATLGDVREAVALGCRGPNQLKAFVRAGMGPCQGRFCGLTVCEALARERGESPERIGYLRLRMPVKPVSLGALSDMTVGGDHYPAAKSHAATPVQPPDKVNAAAAD